MLSQYIRLPLSGAVALRLRGGYILLKLFKSYDSVKHIFSPILISIIKEHKKRCYRSNIFLNNQISKAYASSISETTPEPTVLPPSRSLLTFFLNFLILKSPVYRLFLYLISSLFLVFEKFDDTLTTLLVYNKTTLTATIKMT